AAGTAPRGSRRSHGWSRASRRRTPRAARCSSARTPRRSPWVAAAACPAWPGRRAPARPARDRAWASHARQREMASTLAQSSHNIRNRRTEGLFLARLRTLFSLLPLIGAALAAPAMAETTLRLVPHSDLKVLDPIWTTAYITRNHGYLIYDVLFAKD